MKLLWPGQAGQDVTASLFFSHRPSDRPDTNVENTFSRSTTIPAQEDALLDLEEALLSYFGQKT
jgi:hypothetical protein